MLENRANRFVVIMLAVFISALFLAMIRSFLMAILLAGIFSSLARPMYLRFILLVKGRRTIASILTLMVIMFLILIPLGVLSGVVTDQALKISQLAASWVKAQTGQEGRVADYLKNAPFSEWILPHSEFILRKAGEMMGQVGKYLFNNLSSLTMSAVNFFFILFVWLYGMYFFLMDGDKLMEKILYYLPLQDSEEQLMVQKFTSVARATLKGTAFVGILQGGLAGMAFWVVGIPGATFWGVIMTILSIIPSVGTALVWGPAVVVLALDGATGKAVGLLLFCALVVGSVDNLLRPILVGKDTQMHELMIFFGTLGGISMFGLVGVIIGPIISALFVTIWEIYGQAFEDILPDTSYMKEEK